MSALTGQPKNAAAAASSNRTLNTSSEHRRAALRTCTCTGYYPKEVAKRRLDRFAPPSGVAPSAQSNIYTPVSLPTPPPIQILVSRHHTHPTPYTLVTGLLRI